MATYTFSVSKEAGNPTDYQKANTANNYQLHPTPVKTRGAHFGLMLTTGDWDCSTKVGMAISS